MPSRNNDIPNRHIQAGKTRSKRRHYTFRQKSPATTVDFESLSDSDEDNLTFNDQNDQDVDHASAGDRSSTDFKADDIPIIPEEADFHDEDYPAPSVPCLHGELFSHSIVYRTLMLYE
jgi:hypothetical protein